MTTPNSFRSCGAALILRLASALVLAGCALWTGTEFPSARSKTAAPANPPPTLRGREAVEQLKQEELDASPVEAIVARYNAEALTLSGAYHFSATAQCPQINITPSSLTRGTVGTFYNQPLATTAGTPPINFAVTSGALPPNLTLSSSGVISGVPATAGTFNLTVTATDAFGCTGSQAYTFVISCPEIHITPSSLSDGSVGAFYNQTLATTAGNQPITFAVTSGSLPPGLTLSPQGILSGAPTGGGAFSFTITATDAFGCTGKENYTIVVTGCPLITINPTDLPAGAVNAPYNQTLTASGGIAPISFSITSGSLPPGLTLSPTGIISGTPTATGSFVFTVRATDGAGCFVERPYEVIINLPACSAIRIAPVSLPPGNIGLGYNQTLTASGGTPPLTFSVLFGSLPPGLTLSPTGEISGIPTAIGVFTFITLVTDANGCRDAIVNQVTITCPSITIAPSTLADAQLGVRYDQTLTASGGAGPFTFSLESGELPPGLTLSSTGEISGAPTIGGVFSFRVQATDASAICPVSQNYMIIVRIPAPTSPAFAANPSNNTARNVGVAAVLGGLGVLIGREAGRDSAGIRCAPITVIPTITALPAGAVGQAYSQTFTSSGGGASLTFTLKGSPPPGLTLSSDGTLSGSPTATGTFTFSVAATDSKNCGGERAYTLVVKQASNNITINPETLPAGTAGLAYKQTLTASGGSAPFAFSGAGGSLPTGLTLSASGLISGTLSAAGTSQFTALVTDRNGQTGTQVYAITVNPPCSKLSLTPTALPQGEAGQSYSQILKADGGTGPFTFSLLSGVLPVGLILDQTTGSISGKPSLASTFDFTLKATDSGGCAGAAAYSLRIAPRRFTTLSATGDTLPVSPKEMVTGFGSGLANMTASASSPPLPITLAGMRVTVKDSVGVERAARLLLISPTLITYQIPDGAAHGAAYVSVFSGDELIAEGRVQIVGPRRASAPRTTAAPRRKRRMP